MTNRSAVLLTSYFSDLFILLHIVLLGSTACKILSGRGGRGSISLGPSVGACAHPRPRNAQGGLKASVLVAVVVVVWPSLDVEKAKKPTCVKRKCGGKKRNVSSSPCLVFEEF